MNPEPDGAWWQKRAEWLSTELQRVQSRRDAMEAGLRAAWESGFKLCRDYGDNHAHFDGVQKEAQWLAFLRTQEAVALPTAVDPSAEVPGTRATRA